MRESHQAIEMYLFLFDRVWVCLSLPGSPSALRFSPWPLGRGEPSEGVTLETMSSEGIVNGLIHVAQGLRGLTMGGIFPLFDELRWKSTHMNWAEEEVGERGQRRRAQGKTRSCFCGGMWGLHL